MAQEVERAILEERWRCAVYDGLLRFKDENSIETYMGKDWHRIQRSLENLAARLDQDNGVSAHEYSDDEDGLLRTTEAIWDFIREQLIAWRMRAPERHARWVERLNAEEAGTAA